MENVGNVANPFLPEVRIPCLLPPTDDGSWYDKNGFLGFPSRRGWDPELIKRNQFDDGVRQNSLSCARFTQSWLWFGLLSAFFGHNYSMQTLMRDFTTTNGQNQIVLTTGNLEAYLRRWQYNHLSAEDMGPQSLVLQDIEAVLRETNVHVSRYMCRSLYGQHPAENHPMRRHLDVALAIQALGTVLERAKHKIWASSSLINWRQSDLVYDRLVLAGWCPSDVNIIERSMSPSGAYYVSLLPPRMQGYTHTDLCDVNACAAMNVCGQIKTHYESRHDDACDKRCRFLDVKEAELASILQQEAPIPVVTRRINKSGEAVLSLDEADMVPNFVAISHVWIEGRGNVHENALPDCQLSYIQAQVDRVAGVENTPFWLDTLCIPQDEDKPHLRDLKRQAIRSMNSIYKRASLVLVFDAELMSIRLNASVEERMVRFMCSNWIRRLWTMQEAVSGAPVILQFADGYRDLFGEFFNELKFHAHLENMMQTLLVELGQYLSPLQELRETHTDLERIRRVWNASRHRSTSVHQDEAICLSIILGLSIATRNLILEEDEDQRWRTFILQQRVFPKELLFTTGARMDVEGFRWAPESFIRQLGTGTVQLQPTYGTGEASADGFTTPACGLVFASEDVKFGARRNERAFWLFTGAQRPWLRVAQRNVDANNVDHWDYICSEVQHNERVALILLSNLLAKHDRMRQSLGILVRLASGANTLAPLLRCNYAANVVVEPETRDNELSILPQLRQLATTGKFPPDGCWTADAVMVSEEQLWCIG